MTGGILLLIAVSVSFVVIRFGAVALELTGLSWESSKFQSLSAFTNSGFTTSESEKITSHPVRRKIAATLIILGNAGFVATIGSFAGSVLQPTNVWFYVNFAGIFFGLALLGWIARHPKISTWLHRRAQKWLDGQFSFSELKADDLLHLNKEYRLSYFEINDSSELLGQALNNLHLKQHVVQILRIDRESGSIPIPGGRATLQSGDKFVVYGKAESIIKFFGKDSSQELLIVKDSVTNEDEVQR